MPLSWTSVVTLISLSVPQLGNFPPSNIHPQAGFSKASTVSAACECGYSTHAINTNQKEFYTDVLESDFLRLKDFNAQTDWDRQVWDVPPVGSAKWGRNNTAANVRTNPGTPAAEGGVEGNDPGLQIWVSSGAPEGGNIASGEVATRRRDMLYGSFRAGIKYTGESGTCGAFFWVSRHKFKIIPFDLLEANSFHQQFDDRAEIDVEFLSKLYVDPANTDILLVIHAPPEVPTSELFRPTPVGFRPSVGYHEYRFDWTPDSITYYADSKLMWESKLGVPTRAGGLLLSHWSNGDPGWSNGPPAKDAHMEFSYVKAYFNTTASDADYKLRCRDPQKPDAVCTVPDQTSPPDPRKSTTFLSPNKGLPGGPAAAAPAPASPAPPDAGPMVDPRADPAGPVSDKKKEVTPDATCGGEKGYTCLGGDHGDCCSSYGF
ncbi:MAG: hypothetical protein LQ345_003113, partial [Seirophora villosa]